MQKKFPAAEEGHLGRIRDQLLPTQLFRHRGRKRAILADKPDLTFASIPAEMLRAVWTWNDHRGERSDKMGERCFVPMIMFFRIDGRASRVAAWPRGAPILLPRVDFVLVDRLGSGSTRFGLAPWSEVRDIARSNAYPWIASSTMN
jgi:hypothetical protein